MADGKGMGAMLQSIVEASAYAWGTVHVAGVIISARLWLREKRTPYGWFIVSWAAMAVAGFLAHSPSVPVLVALVAMRVVASVTGLVALVLLSRLARTRIVTIYSTSDGSINARGQEEVITAAKVALQARRRKVP